MSFDVFLQRFHDGEAVDSEWQPIRDVVTACRYKLPSSSDPAFYGLAFPDGGEAELAASPLDSGEPVSGCTFFLHEFSDDLAAFMLEVARAGNMVMMPTMEESLVILVAEEQQGHLPPDVSDTFQPVLIVSPGELGAVLMGGLEAWTAYRDHVVG